MLRFARERLHAIRMQKNCTQFQLAKDCGCGLTSVSRWENGETTPRLIDVYRISQYFDVPMEYFVIDADNVGQI